MSKQSGQTTIERSPVVVVMGHIDHGKSTLLDFIRKSNIVDKEAGGITQHLSAYEISHKDEHGIDKRITFLDTPGHESFSGMRARGAKTADIAILVVSAEDSVKQQTLEAWKTIEGSGIAPIVAINKIDRPGANVEKTKNDLTENGIYLEGYGGDIPYVAISAKEGTGVSDLLDVILLVAEMKELRGTQNKPAEGVVIEAHLDVKRGISASLVIKDGTLRSGMFVVADDAIATTRIFEDFLGAPIKEASFSSPIRITGFSKLPPAGSMFFAYEKKKEAEEAVQKNQDAQKSARNTPVAQDTKKRIPLIIKTDVLGTREAIEKEIQKLELDEIGFKIIGSGVGAIAENDLKLASSDTESIVVGFNVKIDASARDINESLGITIQTFDVIYKLIDYLKTLIEERRPRHEIPEVTGSAKILKCFSATKDKQVVGGKVVTGTISAHSQVRILRRDNEIGTGKIIELQVGKIKSKDVAEGNECGMMIETKTELAPGDVIESFIMVTK
jgi:translation initiation factor IF-2